MKTLDLTLKAKMGVTLGEVSKEAMELATKLGETVRVEFNGALYDFLPLIVDEPMPAVKVMRVHLHASREQAWEAAGRLGFTGESLKLASFAGYEHVAEYEMSDNGSARLIRIDGIPLEAPQHG